MKIVKCDICGSNNHKIVYTIEITDKTLRYYRYARNITNKEKMTGTHYMVKCNNCDLMFTNPRFSTDELNFVYLGRYSYSPIWNLQKKIHEAVKDSKIGSVVLFLEHEHVYTFGKNADQNFLLNVQLI